MWNLVIKELCNITNTALIWYKWFIICCHHWCKILVVTDLKQLQSSKQLWHSDW